MTPKASNRRFTPLPARATRGRRELAIELLGSRVVLSASNPAGLAFAFDGPSEHTAGFYAETSLGSPLADAGQMIAPQMAAALPAAFERFDRQGNEEFRSAPFPAGHASFVGASAVAPADWANGNAAGFDRNGTHLWSPVGYSANGVSGAMRPGLAPLPASMAWGGSIEIPIRMTALRGVVVIEISPPPLAPVSQELAGPHQTSLAAKTVIEAGIGRSEPSVSNQRAGARESLSPNVNGLAMPPAAEPGQGTGWLAREHQAVRSAGTMFDFSADGPSTATNPSGGGHEELAERPSNSLTEGPTSQDAADRNGGLVELDNPRKSGLKPLPADKPNDRASRAKRAREIEELMARQRIWSELGEALQALDREGPADASRPVQAEREPSPELRNAESRVAQDRSSTHDEEGGMVELVAGPGPVAFGDETLPTADFARHLATLEIKMEAGVAVFQAFEMATAPGDEEFEPGSSVPSNDHEPHQANEEAAAEQAAEPVQGAAAAGGLGLVAGLRAAIDRWRPEDARLAVRKRALAPSRPRGDS